MANRKKILVVDSADNWQVIFNRTLSKTYNLQIAKNDHEAEKFIKEAYFDLIIVDFLMNEKNLRGYRVLQLIRKYYPFIPTIVVSSELSFGLSTKDLNNTSSVFQSALSLFSTLYIDLGVKNIIEKLKIEKKEILQKKVSQVIEDENNLNLKQKVDFLVITTLEEEFKQVLSRFPDKHRFDDGQYLTKVTAKKNKEGTIYRVAILCLNVSERLMGTTIAGIKTVLGTKKWQPNYVLLVGRAAGIQNEKSDVNLGDVLVGKKIVDVSVKNVKTSPFWKKNFPKCEEPLYHDIDAALHHAAALSSLGWHEYIKISRPPSIKELKVHTNGQIISSNEKVDDPKLVKFYKEQFGDNVFGIEMEGGGVAMALKEIWKENQKVGLLMIRGISDFAGSIGNKDEEKKIWANYACETAAAYTLAFLESYPVSSLLDEE